MFHDFHRRRNGVIGNYKVAYKQNMGWKNSFTATKFINLQDLQPCSLYTIEVE